MNLKVGDIVEVLPGAPYVVTKAGTQWVVYEIFHHKCTVGKVPVSMEAFMHNKKKNVYVQQFTLENQFLKVIRKMGSNKDFAKDLLSQGDIWEEEQRPKKKKIIDSWKSWVPF